jgi:hydrogenase maturation factor HypF (carbamoyltransferase family)
MPGAAAAIRQPWRMAAAYLDSCGDADTDGLAVARPNALWGKVLSLARLPVHSPLTSSAGRLFDAAAALLGVRDEINYERQAAVELEQLADPRADLIQAVAGNLRAAAALLAAATAIEPRPEPRASLGPASLITSAGLNPVSRSAAAGRRRAGPRSWCRRTRS